MKNTTAVVKVETECFYVVQNIPEEQRHCTSYTIQHKLQKLNSKRLFFELKEPKWSGFTVRLFEHRWRYKCQFSYVILVIIRFFLFWSAATLACLICDSQLSLQRRIFWGKIWFLRCFSIPKTWLNHISSLICLRLIFFAHCEKHWSKICFTRSPVVASLTSSISNVFIIYKLWTCKNSRFFWPPQNILLVLARLCQNNKQLLASYGL